MGWRGTEKKGKGLSLILVPANYEVIKAVLGIFVAGTLSLTTGCAELKEMTEGYKTEQAAEEGEQNRIRTLDLDQPIAKLTVEAISEEFESNSVMAGDKYMNQPVEITGYIGSMDDSLLNEKTSISPLLVGSTVFFCELHKPRSAPEVRELREEMRVAVRGVVTSEEMGVGLSRCKFWSFSQDRWIGAQAVSDSTEQPQKKTSPCNGQSTTSSHNSIIRR